jgi:hypothetical protein
MQSTGQTSTQALSLVPMQGSQMMYATDVKYTGGFPGRTALAAVVLASLALAIPDAAAPGGAWRAAPEYLPLFTAENAHRGAYETYTSPLPLDAVLQALASDPALLHPPGAWTPAAVTADDAFGRQGAYNRWALARLYGARRASIARGPRAQDGRVAESWTLISPYPDASLERLEPGTLLIVLHLP